MITKAFLGALAHVATFFLNLMPHVTIPDWVTTTGSYLAGLTKGLSGLGLWMPLGAIGSAVLFLMAVFAASVAIAFGKIVASFFTGGGGST